MMDPYPPYRLGGRVETAFLAVSVFLGPRS